MKSAVFLDRDGTINPDEKGYISSPDDFTLYPFSAPAIRIFNQLDFHVFVVTNQSGIARGYFSHEQVAAVHARMHELLAQQQAQITEVFIAPWHPDGTVAPWNVAHEERKPGQGMFKKALQKYHFRISSSYMIGDKESDIAFGRRAGLTTILVRSGYGEATWAGRQQWSVTPHYVVDDLLAAARLIEYLENNR
jgi:histidinol-phosphate phosphatase family protein